VTLKRREHLHRRAFMAAARGPRAPCDASGTRGAIKATTYADRFVIKMLTAAALTGMRDRGVETELLKEHTLYPSYFVC
jgi:hypothetical protein